MTKCIICEKHNSINKYIYKSNYISVSHGPLGSQILGYMYIELKRHVENWDELTTEEFTEISIILKKATSFLRLNFNVERVYTVTISESVRHLHVHVIPRYINDKLIGLPLIEQATQQKNSSYNTLTEKQIDDFIILIRDYLETA